MVQPATVKVIASDGDSVTLAFAASELVLINNALNDVVNGLDLGNDTEFATRIGAARQDTQRLLEEVHAAVAVTSAKLRDRR